MKIATWNISSGIDISNYKSELFDKEPEISTNEKCLQEIAKLIIEKEIDVIALQEIITTNSFLFMEKLSKLTGLNYYEKFENSPGFLIKNTSMGLGILSKFPIEVEKKELFRNPELTKKTDKGVYSSHNKGFIAVKINNAPTFNLVCSQFLPFHRFNEDILNYKYIFKGFEDYINKTGSIVCADFNVTSGQKKLCTLLNKTAKTHNFVFNEITTTDGKCCDNIAVPKNIKIKISYIEKLITPSDHFLCIVEI